MGRRARRCRRSVLALLFLGWRHKVRIGGNAKLVRDDRRSGLEKQPTDPAVAGRKVCLFRGQDIRTISKGLWGGNCGVRQLRFGVAHNAENSLAASVVCALDLNLPIGHTRCITVTHPDSKSVVELRQERLALRDLFPRIRREVV